MKKTITIDGKECHFRASGATPIFYKNKFNDDLLVDMNKVVKEFDPKGESIPANVIEKFGHIAYIMHKQGDPEQPDDFIEWLDQFEMFSIMEVLPEILELWGMNTKQTSTPKKENAR